MPKRSKRQQNRLNRELFGPGPKSPRWRPRRVVEAMPPRPGTPGSCWACGDCCEPYGDPWTCLACGVVYQPVEA